MGKTLIGSLAEFRRLQALGRSAVNTPVSQTRPAGAAASPVPARAGPASTAVAPAAAGSAPAGTAACPAPPSHGPAGTGAPAALDEADRALFRQAMRHVQPLPEHRPRARARGRREPDAWLQARRLHAQGDPAAPGQRPAHSEPPVRTSLRPPTNAHDPDAREFLQAGCGTDLLHGLRRGKWPIQATLDLHGSHLDQAIERLERFLSTCLEHGIRCVLIVHGKGIGSRRGTAILKTAVRTHLGRLACVQAWAECAERDGGAGAVTVLLRRSTREIPGSHP
ncbi:Smr/MutS family protein [Castellaniella sp.]|uniref:Smr/MutS family protein n=1 Tax=Castellaniella sp. TaxID=1955812 RepID=UPI0035603572